MNYLIKYTKQNGKNGLSVAKGKNEIEALNHAKFNIHTGKYFEVIGSTTEKSTLSNTAQRQ